MIKKVVISAAGRGTRMKGLSKDKPKHLIEVNGKPFIFYLLENLKKAGLEDIVIVVGYKKEILEKFISKYDSNITIINQFEKLGNEYGTACPIKCVEDIMGNEQFLSVCGDDLYSVSDIKNMMKDDDYHYVSGTVDEHPETKGVLITEDGYLEKIIEKPKEFVGDLVNTGMYKFTPEIFKIANGVRLSSRGEYELTDSISYLAKRKKVKVKKVKEYWLEFTRPEDVIAVSDFLKNNQI
ncbi:NTP transferase domain-containing protein [Patescibacteria group bacterium]|nr:NTP transferase domain-containing protein [Patescibacteria group bacterium]MBU1952545.1 NTP transferase domain-containing protein [Patescibacteria group bacterium]